MRKNKFTLSIIFILIFANISTTLADSEVTNFFLIKNNINSQYLESQNNYYNNFFGELSSNNLLMGWENLLSNKMISLESRYEIANYISKILGNDFPIMYLCSFEIGKIFNGKIMTFHQGVLITFENEKLAVLIEHGSNLLNANDRGEIIKKLSLNYSSIILASCYSNLVAKNFPNVFGFSGELSIEMVINYLSNILAFNNEDLTKLFNSNIRKFTLSVSQETISIDKTWAIYSYIQDLVKLNGQKRPIINPNIVTLLDIIPDPGWGVQHINKKTDCRLYLDNEDVKEILRSGVGIIFKDECETYHKLIMYKLEIGTRTSPDSWRLIAILIGLRGLPVTSPEYLTYESYTIRTAMMFKKITNRDPIPNPNPDINRDENRDIREQLNWNWIGNGIIVKTTVSQLPYSFSQIPYVLGDIDLSYLTGATNPISIPEINPEDWTQINIWLNEVGTSIIEYIDSLDTAQTWAISLVLLIVIVAGIIIAIPTEGLSLIVSGLALYGLMIIFGLKYTNTNPFYKSPFPPPRFIDTPRIINSIDEVFMTTYTDESEFRRNVISSEDDFTNYTVTNGNFIDYLDDDNDGISNLIESTYFELCIEPTLSDNVFALISDGSIFDGITRDNYTTWLDPSIDYDNDGLLTITELLYNANPFKIDSDLDGLTDDEEIHCLETPILCNTRLTDSDNDSLLDTQQILMQEVIEFKSNPVEFDSDYDGLGDYEEKFLQLNPLRRDTDGDTLLDGWEVYTYAVRWENSPNENYDYYMDFVNPLLEPIDPTDWAAQDIDNDGLNNTIESRLFTNPYISDTDSDSISDALENDNGLDPTNPNDVDYDYDHDGVSTLEEITIFGTSFLANDTDSDGLLDGEEIQNYGTDPLEADTDADGIDDFEEVFIGTDGYVTDPTKWDTDDDFMSDGYEIANDLDPTDDDFDDDGLLDGEELLIYHSDPTKTDTDGDGLNDYTEVFTYNTDPADADSDNDGLSDKEEVLLLGDGYITDPNDADSDDDGLLDGEEYAYGSNPNNSDTDGDYIPDGEEVIAGTDGYETDPTKWDTDGDGMDDFSEINNGLDPTFNDASVDSDNDALNNLEEFYLGTDPHDADSDNDGMKDGWEVTYSLNPLSDDATGDADGDGLKNIDEYLYDCNPRDSDSDNDGLNDKQEVVTYGTDPNDSDTDNDGWSDYYEVYTIGTSPTKADTDGDGIADRTEYYWWINTYGQSSTSAKSKIKIKDVDGDRLSDGYEKSHNYNPLDSDMDNDGLSDGDEVCTYHTDPKDSDSDNDGYSDLTELINGTDPNDPTDYPGSGGGGGGGWIP